MQLFVYGTLMDDALVIQLTGRAFRTQPALLAGYRTVVVSTPHPFILPDVAATVHGLVLYDVDAEALRAFDHYEDEGRLYRRVAVMVRVGDIQQEAMTYVGIAEALTG